jgi:hypothetical protein
MFETAAKLRALRDENRVKADKLLAWADLLEQAALHFDAQVALGRWSAPETGTECKHLNLASNSPFEPVFCLDCGLSPAENRGVNHAKD